MWRNRTTIGFAAALACCVSMIGCSSLSVPTTNTPPATIAYMVAPDGSIVGYSTIPSDYGAQVVSLTLPSSLYSQFVGTDSVGEVYVVASDVHAARYVLVYPSNANGVTAPLRQIDVGYLGVSGITVDAARRVYLVSTNASNVAATVQVYPSTASGSATPVRTVETMGFDISGIAAASDGTIYLSGTELPSGGGEILVYAANTNGSSVPTRTISVGNTANVYGVAVGSNGHIFANVCPGYCTGTAFAIEEFAPGAAGVAAPINTIALLDIPPSSNMRGMSGGPIYIDGSGTIFTSMCLVTAPYGDVSYLIEGFGPDATGTATPTVQITPTNVYGPRFAVN